MLRALRGKRNPHVGAGQRPALLLDQGQPPKLALYLPPRREQLLQRRLVLKAGEGVRNCPRPKHTDKPRRRNRSVLAVFPNREKGGGSDDCKIRTPNDSDGNGTSNARVRAPCGGDADRCGVDRPAERA